MSYPRGLDEYTETELLTELRARVMDQVNGKCDYCHYPAGKSIREVTGSPNASDSCRMHDRHAGMAPNPELLFAIMVTNGSRVQKWHPGFPLERGPNAWTVSDWTNALAGEAGELANVAKKIRRLECGLTGRPHETMEVMKEKAAEEFADVILYADLVAHYLDINPTRAIAMKFNKTSEEYGFPERMRV